VGAWPRHRLGEIAAPGRLVRRFGAEAPYAASLPDGPAGARGVTAQELHWGVAVEGALSIADLIDRRTRLGLVPTDGEESTDAAAAAFDRAGVEPLAD
jgi:glycerol-3-phosphate dehydrogenase